MVKLFSSPARDIGTKIKKLSFLMSRIAEQTLRDPADLTFAHYRILRMLLHAGRLSQKDVATFHGVTEAAVSRQVEHLVKNKFVTRIVNPANRREHVLTLTTAGKRKAERAKASLDRRFTELFAVLNAKQQKSLRDNLDAVLAAIWEERGKVMCGPQLNYKEHRHA